MRRHDYGWRGGELGIIEAFDNSAACDAQALRGVDPDDWRS